MALLRPLAGAALTSALLVGAATPADAASVTAPAAPIAVPAVAAAPASGALSPAGTTARPANGRILYAGISGGQGTLKIKNGTSKDAVVTLVRGRSKAISVYVRARSRAVVDDVRDGTYRIYFTTGYRFSISRGRFTSGASYQRFDDRLRYTTTSSTSTIWTLTLNPVRGGNASTSGVNPNDFPV
ncbi:hypothetical protein FHS43_002143 [Streptosporangium becharense]|uniref:Uncharacterized protein n=1 Tax=Streptosporangium becharense TaxID=1816182 RepID=A0A7W9IBB2_9ACTN|nr:hypothetical protein [Streptosporangium becharense]MBB2910880.1 hypothetical protein [Streptosporangium becharense]MBB5817575.1 hypothetical protein [Streptosporangium becharense]